MTGSDYATAMWFPGSSVVSHRNSLGQIEDKMQFQRREMFLSLAADERASLKQAASGPHQRMNPWCFCRDGLEGNSASGDS